MNKYEITDETIQHGSRTLHRIKALRDIESDGVTFAHKGDLGGYIESENNLAQDGNAWVCDNARVCGGEYQTGDMDK